MSGGGYYTMGWLSSNTAVGYRCSVVIVPPPSLWGDCPVYWLGLLIAELGVLPSHSSSFCCLGFTDEQRKERADVSFRKVKEVLHVKISPSLLLQK